MNSEWHLTNGRDRKRVLAEHLEAHPAVNEVGTLHDHADEADLVVRTITELDRVPPAITRMLARYDYGIESVNQTDSRFIILVR